MFRTLLVKEWKEKAPIAAFGLALMIVFLIAVLAFQDKRDLNDIVAAGFTLLVFPFIGLLLGAGAFETEFRDGAWAYLLSRPVRKETIWLAKLAASLAYLAALWGIFLILIRLVPALGTVVSGFALPAGFRAETSFLPLAVISSFFYFSIAFSFSLLSEKQFSVLFAALFVGFVLQAILTSVSYALEFKVFLFAARRDLWLIPPHQTGLALMSLAFLAASLWTFRRADFSQPRKKAFVLARAAAALVVLSWVAAFGAPLVISRTGEDSLHGVFAAGDKAFFSATSGIYRYDIGRDKLRALSRSSFSYLEGPPSRTGTLLCSGRDWTELWTMNGDGSGRRRVVSAGLERGSPLHGTWLYSGLLSQDGRTIVFIAQDANATKSGRNPFSFWSVAADGSGLKELPLDPALAGRANEESWFRLIAWPRGDAGILLFFRDYRGREGESSLWTYDPSSGACRPVLGSGWILYELVSPDGGLVSLVYRSKASGNGTVGLLDLKTMALTGIIDKTPSSGPGLVMAWNPTGDRLAILDEPERGAVRVSVYSLAERRVAMSKTLLTGLSEFPPGARIGWIGDAGRLCWSDFRSRLLRIMAPDLTEEKTIAIPGGLGDWPFAQAFAPEAVLLSDQSGRSLWRLDLRTEKWKKIW